MPYIPSSTLNFNYLMIFFVGVVTTFFYQPNEIMKCPPGYELSRWDTINANPSLKPLYQTPRFNTGMSISQEDPEKIFIACVKK